MTLRLGFKRWGGREKRERKREGGGERERLLFFLRLFACFLEVSCTRLSDGFDVLGIGTVAGSLDAVFDSRDLLRALVGCTAPSLYLKSILSFQALWLLRLCSKLLEVAVRFFFFLAFRERVCNSHPPPPTPPHHHTHTHSRPFLAI